MRVAFHHHRAVADVRQQDVGNVGVVLQQVALGQPELGPEDLAEIREADLFALDGQNDIVLIAGDDQPRAAHLIGGSLGGRAPWRTAPRTGT